MAEGSLGGGHLENLGGLALPALVVPAEDLPGDPLDAAAAFYADILPAARAGLARLAPENGDQGEQHEAPEAEAGAMLILFAPADHTHTDWRCAAIAQLAREAAPLRVNAIAGEDEEAIAEVARWLAGAPGVTGQVLTAGNSPEKA